MTIENQMIADILNRGLDDWINFPVVAEIVGRHLPATESDRLLAVCLKVVRQLLSERLVKVGDLSGVDGAFRSWVLDDEASVAEIERRWKQFGGPFDKETGDDVCWLSNTADGDRVANDCLT